MKRALVLGGGGVTGAAWELGLVAGLVAEGLDLARADLIVGTSAGAVTGAQLLSGMDLESLYQRQLEPPVDEIAARLGVGLIARQALIMITSTGPKQLRMRMGKLALHSRVVIMVPLGRRSGVLPGADKQADDLRAAGARVVVVSPDQAARTALGHNILDPEQRATAARAGRAQAAAVAAGVREVWHESEPSVSG